MLFKKQILQQAKDLGISEEDVIQDVMLKETVDGNFMTVEDVAAIFCLFEGNALTGKSLSGSCYRPVVKGL
jgi:3-hydroxybutyrate dehydrogenase